MPENGLPANILVVDDEPDLELLIKQKFRKKVKNNEFNFTFANNGLEALNKIQEHDEIDIVLTDINMPEMDGLTLVSKLTEQYPTLRSVIVSAYGDMGNIRKALNFGAFDFITKPINFEDLEITIDKTIQEVTGLKEAEDNRNKLSKIQDELNVAYQIQSSMVPRNFPPYPDRNEFDIFAKMYPAKNVGGDFYDFFLIDPYHLYFLIGDVSGKGVPAALFMAMSRTLLRATAMRGIPPDVCLSEVNKLLSLDNESSMFVTVFAGVLNTFTGEVVYCNGGHNMPYIIKNTGEVQLLENTNGVALAFMDEENLFGSKSYILNPGDKIFLYTDGVTEATDSDNFLFTDERLNKFLTENNKDSITDLINKTVEEVYSYSSGTTQSDDITALCVQYMK
ncbi:MAG: fused response regulator/phosphatase [Candidatus Dadabacteria bacterium]|nr:fused response regulator/phosphatase [Candidatus Dadabacteria bacterium]NIS07219.1 fused response regulator/phosphatase [Candidatus Dadabacteria bacterium]NIV40926.1 SpoIIE family protein phosphatase [Candidatus Dadabacteria bacterium]NIX14358.1 SpoIIE family protein phosphatase [Candidatus Dadabacteria bacterium]NIY20876.1 SpoIIE family protein phosphatase [Candidatus Dadabacteria bacterium]